MASVSQLSWSLRFSHSSHKQRDKPSWVEAKLRSKEAHFSVKIDEYHSSFMGLIKSCGENKDLQRAKSLHADALQRELVPNDLYVSTALISTYAKCGGLGEAQKLFDELPVRNVVMWSALIVGYVQHGLDVEALNCFKQMQNEGITPDAISFICILKSCGTIGCLEIGQAIHAKAKKQGVLHKNIVLCNTLLSMYVKCGDLGNAQEVFDEMSARDVISWNALIMGYAQHDFGTEALHCFKQMRDDGISPNAVTFVCVLKACGNIRSSDVGKVHAEATKQGLLEKNIVLGSMLVDVYAKCGELQKALNVFDVMPVRNVVTWSALIAAYSRHGLHVEALNCFRRMQEDGISPNAVTFTYVLNACANTPSLEIGEEIHAMACKHGLLKKNVVLGSTLVHMYAKCGELGKAQEAFDKMRMRNVITWSALIAGYTLHGFDVQALNCFRQMQSDGISPNEVTFACLLKACGSIGSCETGEEIHSRACKQGLLQGNIMLGSTLVDMYAKCGELGKAQEAFNEMLVQDVVTWNALICGYAQLGDAKRALDLFWKMTSEDVLPDLATFVAALSACSHAGFVEEGQGVFDNTSRIYHLTPILEHFMCMVDLLGRAGHFDQVIALLKIVHPCDCLPLFLGLLGACRKWVKVEIGRWAFEQSLQLDKKCAEVYACMRDIYGAAGMYADADKIEAVRVETESVEEITMLAME